MTRTLVAFALAAAVAAGPAIAQTPSSSQPAQMAQPTPTPSVGTHSGASTDGGGMGGADTAVKGGTGESANGVTAGSKSGLETPAVTGESPSVANVSGQQLSSAALTARKAIERDGYKDVQGLAKGSDGLWHAQALRGNTQVQVTVDRAGMVSAQ